MSASSDVALYRRVLGETRGHRLRVALIFVLSLLATPLALLTPLPLKVVVDSVVGHRPAPGFLRTVLPDSVVTSDHGLLVVSAAMLVGIVLFTQLQGLATWLLQASTGERVLLAVRSHLFRHVQQLSLAHHDNRSSADFAYRIQYDTPSIEYLAVYGVIPFATSLVMLAGMVVVTARIDWQLATVALLVAPALFVLLRTCQARIREHWRNAKNLDGSAYSVVQETLGALRVVKAFGQEDYEERRFLVRSRAGMTARIRAAVVEGTFDLMVGLAIGLGTATVLYIGTRHVRSGVLTLGDLLLIMGYLAQLYQPLTTMSKQAALLQTHLASAERVYTVFDELPEARNEGGRVPIARARGEVEFRGVFFSYGPGPPVLEDLSLHVEPGTCLGIEGVTGAGKTTIINLLTRFYDPTGGKILLDGRELDEYRLRDLRAQFAIVLQDPLLFSTGIAENIAYGRPGASFDDIVRAAQFANVDDFVRRLPGGYDTPVGERGVQLSGGQRQRISLARAFLKDAPILILDEPTSAVDATTEGAIVEAVGHLVSGRTAFLISHRGSTLAPCHARIRIDDGRAVHLPGSASPSQLTHARHRARPVHWLARDGRTTRAVGDGDFTEDGG